MPKAALRGRSSRFFRIFSWLPRRRRSAALGSSAVALALLALNGGALAKEQGTLYQPWIGLQGSTDIDNFGGGGQLYVPFKQAPGQVLFGYAQGNALVNGAGNIDLGIGYRQHEDGLGLGGYALFGGGWSENGNNALRGTLGLEVFGESFDANLTGYYVFSNDEEAQDHKPGSLTGEAGDVFVESHDIRMLTQLRGGTFEKGASGLSGEFGYHFYGEGVTAPPLSDYDLRLAVGGYAYFPGNGGNTKTGPFGTPLPDEDYETIYGGTFSGELRLYEVPSLGENSYLYLGAGGSYDNQEELEGTIALGIRIPFWGPDARTINPARIEDRMVDPLRIRDIYWAERDIPRSSLIEPVYSPFSQGANPIIDSVWFADSDATGGEGGVEDDPTTIDEAVAGSQGTNPDHPGDPALGDGDIIVVTDPPGDGLTTATGIVLLGDQIMLGGGHELQLRGAITGNFGTYTPNGAPGTIFAGPGVGTVIQTADNVQLIGFNVDGNFSGGSVARIGIDVSNDFNVNLWDLDVSDLGEDVTDAGSDGEAGDDGDDGVADQQLPPVPATGGDGGEGGGLATANASAFGIRIIGSDQVFVTDVAVHDVTAIAAATGGLGGNGGNGGEGFDAINENGIAGGGGGGGAAGDGGDADAKAEAIGIDVFSSEDVVFGGLIEISNINATATGTGGNGGLGGAGGDAGEFGENGVSGGNGGDSGNAGTGTARATAVGLRLDQVDGFSAEDVTSELIGATATGTGGAAGGGGAGGAGGTGGFEDIEDGGAGGDGGFGGFGGGGSANAIAFGVDISESKALDFVGELSLFDIAATSTGTGGAGGDGGSAGAGGSTSQFGTATGGKGGDAGFGGGAGGVSSDAFARGLGFDLTDDIALGDVTVRDVEATATGTGGAGGDAGDAGAGGEGGFGGLGGLGGDGGNGGEVGANGLAFGIGLAKVTDLSALGQIELSSILATTTATGGAAGDGDGGNGGNVPTFGCEGGDCARGEGGDAGAGGAGGIGGGVGAFAEARGLNIVDSSGLTFSGPIEISSVTATMSGTGGAGGIGGDGGDGGDRPGIITNALFPNGGNGGNGGAGGAGGQVSATGQAVGVKIDLSSNIDFLGPITLSSITSNVTATGGLGGEGGDGGDGGVGSAQPGGTGGDGGNGGVGGGGGSVTVLSQAFGVLITNSTPGTITVSDLTASNITATATAVGAVGGEGGDGGDGGDASVDGEGGDGGKGGEAGDASSTTDAWGLFADAGSLPVDLIVSAINGGTITRLPNTPVGGVGSSGGAAGTPGGAAGGGGAGGTGTPFGASGTENLP